MRKLLEKLERSLPGHHISIKIMKAKILETGRLRLRPLERKDAPPIQKYAGDLRVAEMTLLIPHPYPENAAINWIEGCLTSRLPGGPFAIILREEEVFVGVIELSIDDDELRAEVGYWVGPPFWGKGYCTEALKAVINYGFEDLGLVRIAAKHLPQNLASGRVQEKAGLKKEGLLRCEAIRFGVPSDSVVRAITRPDWENQK